MNTTNPFSVAGICVICFKNCKDGVECNLNRMDHLDKHISAGDVVCTCRRGDLKYD